MVGAQAEEALWVLILQLCPVMRKVRQRTGERETVVAQTTVIIVLSPIISPALPARIAASKAVIVFLLHLHLFPFRQCAVRACLACCRVLLAYLDVVLRTDELCAWVIAILDSLDRRLSVSLCIRLTG